MSDDVWKAAEARHRFSDLVDAAVEGHPQFVRRRDGREVVVVWMDETGWQELATTVFTIMEIQIGIERARRADVAIAETGADSRNRTADLLITNQLLYQLS